MDNNQNNQQQTPKKKNIWTSIFFRSYTKDGKGAREDDVIKFDKYDIKTFFKLFARRIRDLIKINWIYIFCNFPVLFLLLAISGNFSHHAPAPSSQFYPIVYGMMTISGQSPAMAPAVGIHGMMGSVTSLTVIDYIFIGLSTLFLVTFGLTNTGCAYLMRNIVKGDHLFIFDDMKSTIKDNFKQGLIFGIIDVVILGLCGFSISYYIANYSQYYILFFCALAVTCFYIFIRQYVYMMMVTFELPLIKILKNSFILATLSLGRCFLGLLGILAIAAILFMLSTLFMPIGVIAVMIIFISLASYIFTYITYPKMKKIMIDPYYPNYGKEPMDEYEELGAEEINSDEEESQEETK